MPAVIEETEADSPAASLPTEGTAKEERRGGLAVLKVLRHPEFAIFWGGQAFSLIGTWMQNFAQSAEVTKLSDEAFTLGLITFATSIPTLLFMPLGGVAADRFERRNILLWTAIAMGLLAAVTGTLVGAHQLKVWHLIGVALMLGICIAFELPAYQSFYPQLISREELPQAIALNQATFNAARIVGPGIAAGVAALWGTAAAFHGNAISFLAVVLSLMFIKRRPPATQGGAASPVQMFREGLAYVRERPVVAALLGVTALTTFCVFPNLAVLMPYHIKHVLRLGDGELGIIMSISGFGSLIGALLLLSVPRTGRVWSVANSAVGIALGLLIIAASHNLWVSVAGTVLISVAISFSVGLSSIMIQETVPHELRGRVMSLYTLMFTGIMPFAALGLTALVDRMTMPMELLLAAGVYGVGMLFLVTRLFNHRDEIGRPLVPEAA